AICTGVFGWLQYRYERVTINAWVDATLQHADLSPSSGTSQAIVQCPRQISLQEQIRLLAKSLNWMPAGPRRTCVLKILAENFATQAHPVFLKIVEKHRDQEVRIQAIRLLSIYQSPEDLPVFVKLLESDSDAVRAAAIDAIGIIHSKYYPWPQSTFVNKKLYFRLRDFYPDYRIDLDTRPIISVESIASYAMEQTGVTLGASVLDRAIQRRNVPAISLKLADRLRRLVATDTSYDVRQAAVRALMTNRVQPQKLRFAEWGVWTEIEETQQSAVPEKLVAAATNTTSGRLKQRNEKSLYFNKCIIQLTADVPLTVDLGLRVGGQRQWFSYPKSENSLVINQSLNRSNLSGIQENVELPIGYRWLSFGGVERYANTEVGLVWSGLVVMPEKQTWMTPDLAGWDMLRDVPVSWVSGETESDRFVFYDGIVELPKAFASEPTWKKIAELGAGAVTYNSFFERRYLFINVKGSSVSTFETSQFSLWDANSEVIDRSNEVQEASQHLIQMLTGSGLTAAEAEGCVASWKPTFFETDGKRMLTIMGTEEYSRLRPMSISPAPTETVRVGIVVTEFGEPGDIKAREFLDRMNKIERMDNKTE
ncbi:MAG: hypothetical protein ACI814_003124, partial [Mariniblastus sp.]